MSIVALVFLACAGQQAPPSVWQLEMHDRGSEATLERPAEHPGLMRITIARAADSTEFNIQLRRTGFRVEASEAFALTFRARAAGPRQIAFGVGMAHAPWEGLGFYDRVEIGPAWQAFSRTFTLKTREANAQLTFNLGAVAVSLELDSIVLRRMPSGDIVIKP